MSVCIFLLFRLKNVCNSFSSSTNKYYNLVCLKSWMLLAYFMWVLLKHRFLQISLFMWISLINLISTVIWLILILFYDQLGRYQRQSRGNLIISGFCCRLVLLKLSCNSAVFCPRFQEDLKYFLTVGLFNVQIFSFKPSFCNSTPLSTKQTFNICFAIWMMNIIS